MQYLSKRFDEIENDEDDEYKNDEENLMFKVEEDDVL